MAAVEFPPREVSATVARIAQILEARKETLAISESVRTTLLLSV
jgi:hypothetical protein